MTLIPAFRKQRDADLCQFKVGQGYILRLCLKKKKKCDQRCSTLVANQNHLILLIFKNSLVILCICVYVYMSIGIFVYGYVHVTTFMRKTSESSLLPSRGSWELH